MISKTVDIINRIKEAHDRVDSAIFILSEAGFGIIFPDIKTRYPLASFTEQEPGFVMVLVPKKN